MQSIISPRVCGMLESRSVAVTFCSCELPQCPLGHTLHGICRCPQRWLSLPTSQPNARCASPVAPTTQDLFVHSMPSLHLMGVAAHNGPSCHSTPPGRHRLEAMVGAFPDATPHKAVACPNLGTQLAMHALCFVDLIAVPHF